VVSTLKIVVLAAVGLLALSGTAFGLTEILRQERDLRTIVRDDVRRIIIHADAGNVEVRAGLTPDVVVDRHDTWLLERPRVRQRVRGDKVLEIDARCRGVTAMLRCDTDLMIAAPPEVDVEVRGEAGDVDLRGLRGRIVISTAAGDVRAERVEPITVYASTDAGDVDLDLFGQPARVEARSDAGDVDVVVPYGPYRVDASTDAGKALVAGLIRDDLAPQAIEAVTGAGDVTVRAR
jgi:hypothetical protein